MEYDNDGVLLKSIPIGIAILQLTDDGYHTLFMNDMIRNKFAKTDTDWDSLINEKIDSFVHPDDLGRIQLILYKSGVTGGNYSEIVRLRTNSGQYSWTDFRLNATPDALGSYLLHLALIDIDAQKETNLKMEHMYEELLGIMNNTPGGIAIFDTKNDRSPLMTFASPGLFRLLQGTEEEITNSYAKNFYSAIHPDDRSNFIRALEAGLRNLSKFRLNIRLRTLPGHYILADASGKAVNMDGHRRLYIAFTNASADREAHQLLTNVLDIFMHQQYENITLVDGQTHSFSILNSNSPDTVRQLIQSNQYEKEIHKLIDTYAIEEEKEQLLYTMQLSSLFKQLEKQKDLEIFITIHVPHTDKLRYKKIWISWLDRETRKLVFIQSDYTELRQRQLEHQTTLLSALRASEQANIAKSTFLSRMSHDIRTPLSAIIGFTEMSLADETACDAMKDRLCKIHTASQFLLSLINDVLDMSRIESGKYSLQREPFALTSLISGVSTIISDQCRNKNLQFQCILSDNTVKYYIGDRLKLQQVLVNILGNSVKFTPAGGSISLTVKEKAAYENHVLLQFSVKDTGIGISKEFIPQLFDAFAQENIRDAIHNGTGLGLAICKNIVSLMNGTIQVHSEKNVGSEFIVEVQLERNSKTASSTPLPSPDELPHRSPTYHFSDQHILLAEDHPMNQEIATYILEQVGFIVDIADNGKIACQKFADSQEGFYAAILLDIRMPEMDGLEAARTIRNMNRKDAKTMPLIAMSADAFTEDISKSLANGINAHLIKPIDKDQLFQTLAVYITPS